MNGGGLDYLTCWKYFTVYLLMPRKTAFLKQQFEKFQKYYCKVRSLYVQKVKCLKQPNRLETKEGTLTNRTIRTEVFKISCNVFAI